jgi:hypothetical protein
MSETGEARGLGLCEQFAYPAAETWKLGPFLLPAQWCVRVCAIFKGHLVENEPLIIPEKAETFTGDFEH